MIVRSTWAKAAALVVAASVVIGGSNFVVAPARVEVEGGEQATPARVGSRFEDMVAGTLTADKGEVLSAATPPEPPAVKAQSAQPPPTSAAAATPTARHAASAPTEVVIAAPESPVVTAAIAASARAVVTTHVPSTTAPRLSQRPEPRDPQRMAQAAARVKKPVKKAIPATKRGIAKRDNAKGAETGQVKAKAAQQGNTGSQAVQSGTAAKSNYPGQVMRKIARVPKPNVSSRGETVVTFAVSASGGLSQVAVARSSGSAALDRAALAVIRKAAPFRAPPAGAQRQFLIKIKGR
jgi:protein TonB